MGVTVSCPNCNIHFVVPLPPSETSVTSRTELLQTKQRNPLLLPIIALATLFVVTVVAGAFYLSRRSSEPSAGSASMPGGSTERMPTTSAQSSRPSISEDTKSRVLNFIEKPSKLAAMTDQGVAFTPFSDQLAEVRVPGKL